MEDEIAVPHRDQVIERLDAAGPAGHLGVDDVAGVEVDDADGQAVATEFEGAPILLFNEAAEKGDELEGGEGAGNLVGIPRWSARR